MIRILIAEDSQVVAQLLKVIFEREPDMQIVGHARNGLEAVQMAHDLRPDLITMDIRMPVMNGFEATRQIMEKNPAPIVVISSNVDDIEMRITFRAIEEGALSVFEKPPGPTHPNFESVRRELVDTVRAMAEVKVIRRRTLIRPSDVGMPLVAVDTAIQAYELLAIGCSTGGPQALHRIFSSLPASFPVPILVTQHISQGFIGGLASWLNANSLLNIKVAQDGDLLQAGSIYFAPDDKHLLVRRMGSSLTAMLSDEAKVNGFRPSANPMFTSVAKICRQRAIGMLLTGMGVDGAEGLLTMRKAGSHTFVQDVESSVVYGMPGAAITLNAADKVVQLEQISSYLVRLVGVQQAGLQTLN